MKNSRIANVSAHRDSWLEINLDSLSNNVKEIKNILKDEKKFLAVVKADAYGHGAAMIAPTLLASGVDMFGVASIDEGLNLRENGIEADILVLGAVPTWALKTAAENNISVSIFSKEHLNACKQIFERTDIPVKAHIKIDTGMNRIGIKADKAVEFITEVQKLEYIDLQGIFTHLAFAEDLDETKHQLDLWENIISQVKTEGLLLHVLNSAGTLSYNCTSNMVRVGISLYGLLPDLPPVKTKNVNLKQVMGLKARITHIHEISAGEGVSYGHTFKAERAIKIATIPVGYADGIPRLLSNKIFGHIDGIKIRQIGNIAMDQMMFDITGIEAQEGDVITLLDESLPITEWANIIGTIHYELTCRLKTRLARVYTR